MCAHTHCSLMSNYDPMDCSPPGSSVHGTIPARILDQVAISSSKGSSRPKDQTCWLRAPAAPALTGRFFIPEPPGKPLSLMWSHLFCLFACAFDVILSLAQPMSLSFSPLSPSRSFTVSHLKSSILSWFCVWYNVRIQFHFHMLLPVLFPFFHSCLCFSLSSPLRCYLRSFSFFCSCLFS